MFLHVSTEGRFMVVGGFNGKERIDCFRCL